MALNRTREQMRDGVRRMANIQGTTATARHPDDDLDDGINQALGALRLLLTAAVPDQRFLASTTITTTSGVTTYALPVDFDFLISLEMTADGRRRWLTAYEMIERPALISPDTPTLGIPVCYRLRGGNIEFLPTPNEAYAIQAWYVPSAQQLATDAATLDTISRLDRFVIAHAAREVAIKDKNWDLVAACKDILEEIIPSIEMLGRNRDRNSPPRVLDVRVRDPWGRTRGWR